MNVNILHNGAAIASGVLVRAIGNVAYVQIKNHGKGKRQVVIKVNRANVEVA